MVMTIAKLLKVLNSETEPGQISLALSFSMIAGLTPFFSVHNLIVLLLVMIIRVNFSSFILGLGLFSAVSLMLDPLFHGVGLKALTLKPLEGLWTAMYNSTLWRIERFNNTVLMGSLLVSLILFIPLYLSANFAIRKYREHVLRWVRKSRLMQAFTGTRLYKAYRSVSEMRDTLR